MSEELHARIKNIWPRPWNLEQIEHIDSGEEVTGERHGLQVMEPSTVRMCANECSESRAEPGETS